jgi:hypothetical protein
MSNMQSFIEPKIFYDITVEQNALNDVKINLNSKMTEN